jgi:hypothetical protein
MLHELPTPQCRPAVDLLLGITAAWWHKAAVLLLTLPFALSSDMFCLGLSGMLWLYAKSLRISMAAECRSAQSACVLSAPSLRALLMGTDAASAPCMLRAALLLS